MRVEYRRVTTVQIVLLVRIVVPKTAEWVVSRVVHVAVAEPAAELVVELVVELVEPAPVISIVAQGKSAVTRSVLDKEPVKRLALVIPDSLEAAEQTVRMTATARMVRSVAS